MSCMLEIYFEMFIPEMTVEIGFKYYNLGRIQRWRERMGESVDETELPMC